jgi:hypothetical protein
MQSSRGDSFISPAVLSFGPVYHVTIGANRDRSYTKALPSCSPLRRGGAALGRGCSVQPTCASSDGASRRFDRVERVRRIGIAAAVKAAGAPRGFALPLPHSAPIKQTSMRRLSASGASRMQGLADAGAGRRRAAERSVWRVGVLGRVPQAAIDRIEVVRGGLSDLYGADAVAAVRGDGVCNGGTGGGGPPARLECIVYRCLRTWKTRC